MESLENYSWASRDKPPKLRDLDGNSTRFSAGFWPPRFLNLGEISAGIWLPRFRRDLGENFVRDPLLICTSGPKLLPVTM